GGSDLREPVECEVLVEAVEERGYLAEEGGVVDASSDVFGREVDRSLDAHGRDVKELGELFGPRVVREPHRRDTAQERSHVDVESRPIGEGDVVRVELVPLLGGAEEAVAVAEVARESLPVRAFRGTNEW